MPYLQVHIFFTECRKSSAKLPIVGTSGTQEKQGTSFNVAPVAEHTTLLQADTKNFGEAKGYLISE